MKIVKATVGAIVHDDGKVLLELRNHEPFKNCWCIPGGHIDFGEQVEESLCREVKEETGLTVREYRFFNYYTEYYKDLNWHAVALVFLVKAEGEPVIQEKEVKEIRWFLREEISPLPLAFEHRRILDDFFSMNDKME